LTEFGKQLTARHAATPLSAGGKFQTASPFFFSRRKTNVGPFLPRWQSRPDSLKNYD